MNEKSGSVLGGILLVAGCCIGAGMLGLPVLSAIAGFQPSLAMFVLSWLFMTCTALLLLEVNLWFNKEVSLISMADKTLGFFGKAVSWCCFLFLFYALGVAYIGGSGELVSDFIQEMTAIRIPNWIGSLLLSCLFGVFIYLGTRAVDLFNRFLMSGLILTYILLVFFGAPYVNKEYLQYKDWSAAIFVLPVMIISFGFHNLIPSLTNYLKRDRKRLWITIVCGSALPLVIYLIWEWLILGLVPVEGEGGFRQALQEGNLPTYALRAAAGVTWIVDLAQYFAFFAIVTSFLGNSLSFVDFLADGLDMKKDRFGKIVLCLLVIVPPFLMSLVYPKIFLTALSYAGAYGAVTLFGILPALMVWTGRYHHKMDSKPIVPGGKITLALVIGFALFIMGAKVFL